MDAVRAGRDAPNLESVRRLALTSDNLTKMVDVLLRVQGCLPVVLMGESGCGKVRVQLHEMATV